MKTIRSLLLQVAKRKPNDVDAKTNFTECNKMVRKQAFERAIAVDVPDKTLAEIHTEFETIGGWTVIHLNEFLFF